MRKEIILFLEVLLLMSFIQCLDLTKALGESDTNYLGNESMLHEANRIWENMKYTTYDHETHIDEADGIYDFDCSGFIDYVLSQVRPSALSSHSPPRTYQASCG